MGDEIERNSALIAGFYAAFAAGDAEAMAASYTPDAVFVDPVFGTLRGAEVEAMWRMLLTDATDLVVVVHEVVGASDGGTARWQAEYPFGPRRRRVVNNVTAGFRIEDGRFALHRDDFSFWTWARQALGVQGLILGWSPVLARMVRKRVRARLSRFMPAA